LKLCNREVSDCNEASITHDSDKERDVLGNNCAENVADTLEASQS